MGFGDHGLDGRGGDAQVLYQERVLNLIAVIRLDDQIMTIVGDGALDEPVRVIASRINECVLRDCGVPSLCR